MKKSLFRMIIIAALACAAGQRAQAMKPLSSEELGGIRGQKGITLYFQDLDATLIQVDEFLVDLTPNTTNDVIFLITDDTYATSLPLGDDAGNTALSFCGSSTDENVPIDVDFLGFKLDTAACTSLTYMNNYAPMFSMVGYGSTAMYWVWDLCKFVVRSPATVAYDVFGLTLGEIFWAEEYIDPDKTLFMHLLLSPLSAWTSDAFIDSNEGNWQLPAGGLTKGQIRSGFGMGGELGLKPGGGSFGFVGFEKSGGSPQPARATSVMLAGKIMDRGSASADYGTQYPNWQTQNRTYYYRTEISDWNIMGEAVIGVHHTTTYTRTGYTGHHSPATGGAAFDMSTIASRVIGRSSTTRPMRMFETATSNRDCNNDGGILDTYLVTYMNGHYTRTVYYPDSMRSSMGPTGAAAQTKDYIIGDLRIGMLEERIASKEWSTNGTFVTMAAGIYETGGGMFVNDISMEYNKVVIPGDRTLRDEINASSELYLIPNRDYGSNGTAGVTNMTWLGDPVGCKPGSGVMHMRIANPCDGNYGSNYPANCLTAPASQLGIDRIYSANNWR